MTEFNYAYTSFEKQIKTKYNENLEHYCSHWRTYFKGHVNRIEIWFLDCKYNPKYKYCRTRLEKEFEELYNY